MLLEKASTTSRMVSPETPPIRTTEITALDPPATATETGRDQPVLSFTAETTTSRIEISEVRPAIAREPKNSTPSRAEAGASEMIVGKAMNARPRPDSATSPTGEPAARKPSAAKTPMAASSSKEELEKPTTRPEPEALDFFFRYEA